MAIARSGDAPVQRVRLGAALTRIRIGAALYGLGVFDASPSTASAIAGVAMIAFGVAAFFGRFVSDPRTTGTSQTVRRRARRRMGGTWMRLRPHGLRPRRSRLGTDRRRRGAGGVRLSRPPPATAIVLALAGSARGDRDGFVNARAGVLPGWCVWTRRGRAIRYVVHSKM
jgi:hypothetical protein